MGSDSKKVYNFTTYRQFRHIDDSDDSDIDVPHKFSIFCVDTSAGTSVDDMEKLEKQAQTLAEQAKLEKSSKTETRCAYCQVKIKCFYMEKIS